MSNTYDKDGNIACDVCGEYWSEFINCTDWFSVFKWCKLDRDYWEVCPTCIASNTKRSKDILSLRKNT